MDTEKKEKKKKEKIYHNILRHKVFELLEKDYIANNLKALGKEATDELDLPCRFSLTKLVQIANDSLKDITCSETTCKEVIAEIHKIDMEEKHWIEKINSQLTLTDKYWEEREYNPAKEVPQNEVISTVYESLQILIKPSLMDTFIYLFRKEFMPENMSITRSSYNTVQINSFAPSPETDYVKLPIQTQLEDFCTRNNITISHYTDCTQGSIPLTVYEDKLLQADLEQLNSAPKYGGKMNQPRKINVKKN